MKITLEWSNRTICADSSSCDVVLRADGTGHVTAELENIEDALPSRPPEPELKPCPFCGRMEHKIISELVYQGGGMVYYVRCGACSACGPTEDTRRVAIDSWNRRA